MRRVLPSRSSIPVSRREASGAFLLEALIGVLIFAFGILGLVGLQAVALRNTNDLQYRGEAVQIANAYIGRMWTANRATLTTVFAGDAGAGGDGYTALVEQAARLPGVAGNDALAPTVVIVNGPSVGSRLATVTVRWQLPGEATPHQYVGASMVGLN
jgi:type IV pilus assembly protein PilV